MNKALEMLQDLQIQYDRYIEKLLEENVPYEESEYYMKLHDISVQINLLKDILGVE